MQVRQYASEVLLLTPCGHNVGRTLSEVAQLAGQPGWWDLPAVKAGRVYIADSAQFCRPGPRCALLGPGAVLRTKYTALSSEVEILIWGEARKRKGQVEPEGGPVT